MNLAYVPVALLVVPVVEIAAFIVIGGQIGVVATLGMVLLTAIIGTYLLRRQGMELMGQARAELDAGRVPAREVADGVMLLVAGILLLTPGFVTDAIGFSLFLPPVRAAIRAFVASRVRVVGPGGVTMGEMGDMMGAARRRASGRDGREDGVVDLDTTDYTRRDTDDERNAAEVRRDTLR